MSGRTKLYQKPGSALIQGHSRTEVPGWRIWLAGLALGLLLAWVAVYVIETLTGPSGSEPDFIAQAIVTGGMVLTAGLPGLLLGSWLGTVLARGMGWKRPVLSAGILAALGALASIGVAVFALGWSLTA